MKKHKIRKDYIKKIVVNLLRYFFLISLSYIVLYQITFMLSQAFKPMDQLYDPSVVWLPKKFTVDNLKLAWETMNYLRSFATTLLIPIGSGLLQIITCSITAYGLARFKFKGSKMIFTLVLFTILIPPQMIIVPTYLNYSHLDFFGVLSVLGRLFEKDIRPNVLDTGLTFYLPAIFGVGLRSGLFIFIYRQFFIKMPTELEEAAYIDGAGPLRTFLSIIIPSSGVVMLTVTIFSVIWHYNDYFLSAMYLTERKTLAVALETIASTSSTQNIAADYTRVLNMSGSLLFIIPVLVMYMILQKRFIRNIDRVGIVG